MWPPNPSFNQMYLGEAPRGIVSFLLDYATLAPAD